MFLGLATLAIVITIARLIIETKYKLQKLKK
jgi:hypothetical protein